jgi:hypothetical protein
VHEFWGSNRLIDASSSAASRSKGQKAGKNIETKLMISEWSLTLRTLQRPLYIHVFRLPTSFCVSWLGFFSFPSRRKYFPPKKSLSSWFWLENADHRSCPVALPFLSTALKSKQITDDHNTTGPYSARPWLWSTASGREDQALPERRTVDVQRDCHLAKQSAWIPRCLRQQAETCFQNTLWRTKIWIERSHFSVGRSEVLQALSSVLLGFSMRWRPRESCIKLT